MKRIRRFVIIAYLPSSQPSFSILSCDQILMWIVCHALIAHIYVSYKFMHYTLLNVALSKQAPVLPVCGMCCYIHPGDGGPLNCTFGTLLLVLCHEGLAHTKTTN